jgi:hypothetical protein
MTTGAFHFIHVGQLWLYEFTKSYTADEMEHDGMYVDVWLVRTITIYDKK